jgi:alkanesulfonate monooxygenase SsuD/methylene tetrahydromethanopterin reductase-like flavin-dependent oxidoreductase (luciferase family)
MASVIDHLSGGRFTLGLGADDEARHFLPWGMPYPSAEVRTSRVGEAIEVVRRLWGEQTSSWRGQHYHLENAVLFPKPIQSPPPIWVGVTRPGNLLLLQIAGRNADGVNVLNAVDRNVTEIRASVEAAAHEAGRDVATITWSRTVGVSFTRKVIDIDQAVRQMSTRAGSYGNALARYFSSIEHHIAGPPTYCLERLLEEEARGFSELIVHFTFDVEGLLRSAASQLETMRIFAREVLPGLSATRPGGHVPR